MGNRGRGTEKVRCRRRRRGGNEGTAVQQTPPGATTCKPPRCSVLFCYVMFFSVLFYSNMNCHHHSKTPQPRPNGDQQMHPGAEGAGGKYSPAPKAPGNSQSGAEGASVAIWQGNWARSCFCPRPGAESAPLGRAESQPLELGLSLSRAEPWRR
eukprot:gene15964-biopygen702